MRQIFGEYPAESYISGDAIPIGSRIVFNSWASQSGCYFGLIAPYFEEFATRNGGPTLDTINALMVLGGAVLEIALTRCDLMLDDFSSLEISWRFHQGSEKHPSRPERQVFVLLYRRRLRDVVSWLRARLAGALERNHCVVFANGVCYRMLAGIPSQGGDVYS